MVVCDLLRCALVLVMVIPGMPLAAMVALLFVVTLAGAPFTSARAAVYTDVLDGERYVLGTAIRPHHVPVRAGRRVRRRRDERGPARREDLARHRRGHLRRLRRSSSRAWVRSRPARAGRGPSRTSRCSSVRQAVLGGSRLVFASQVLRTTMLFGWLAAFYDAPEGVATPLARALGGGALAVGRDPGGAGPGADIGRDRVQPLRGPVGPAPLHGPARRRRLRDTCPVRLASGLARRCWSCSSPARARPTSWRRTPVSSARTPPERRSQAFGLAQGGMNLGQGIGHDPGRGGGGSSFPGAGHRDVRRYRGRARRGAHDQLAPRPEPSGRTP